MVKLVGNFCKLPHKDVGDGEDKFAPRTIGPRAGRDRHGVLSARRDEMSGPPNMLSLTKERFLRGYGVVKGSALGLEIDFLWVRIFFLNHLL